MSLIAHYRFDDFQEPTTNIATGVALGFGDGNRWESVTSYPTGLSFTPDKVWRRKDPNAYWGGFTTFIPTSPTPYNRTFTVSFWYYLEAGYDGSVSSNFFGAPVSGGSTYTNIGTSLNNTFSTSVKGQWLYGQQTIKITTDAYSYNYFQGWSGGTIADGKHCYIANFQLEEKDHATEFVNGSRTGTLTDSSGNNRSIALGSTCPQWVANGKISGCYKFNGSSTYLSIPYTPTGTCIPFSMSCWIKTSTVFAYEPGIISHGYMPIVLIGTDGKIKAWWYTGATYPKISSTTVCNDNKFHHIILTYDAVTMRLYIDGMLEASLDSVTSIIHSGLDIGFEKNNGNKIFNGYIDDVRFYDNALPDKEVKEIAQAKVLHYKMDSFAEPTTNIAPYTDYSNRTYNSPYTASSWGNDVATVTYYKDGGYNNLPYKKMIKTAGGSGGSYLTDNVGIIIEEGKTYAISCWMKANQDISLNGYSMCINRSSDNAYRVGNNPSLTTEWKRYSWIYTAAAGEGGKYQTVHIVYIDTNLPLEVYWCGFQVEQKDHATPYISGSRTGTVLDSSGYDNHAELDANTPQWISGSKVGEGCYDFNGSSQYIQNTSIILNDSKSVSLWLKVASIPSDYRIVFIHPTSKIGLGFYAGDRFILTSNGNSQRCALLMGFTVGSWNHLCISYTASGVPTLYINGSEAIYTTNNYWTASTDIFYIGRRESGNYCDCQIDDFRVYATALSDTDIKELYGNRFSLDDKGTFKAYKASQHMNWDEEFGASNLVLNGNAEVGNNTNFSGFSYYTADKYKGNGCFSRIGNSGLTTDTYIKINKDDVYRLSGWHKSIGSGGLSPMYFGVCCYDKNKSVIGYCHVHHFANTETTLAADLVNGATTVQLTSGTNWYIGTAGTYVHQKQIAFWKSDNEYPAYTYTRTTAGYITISGNVLTLQSAWTGTTIPAGTPVANCYDGSGYNYVACVGSSVPATWTKYTNTITGWGVNRGENIFRYGTEYVRILWLVNWGKDSTYQTLIDEVAFINETKSQTIPVQTQFLDTGEIKTMDYSECGITEGLVAWYPLNGNALDMSPYANDGVVTGATITQGQEQLCYSFDGTDDYIDLGNPGNLVLYDGGTVSAWVNLDTFNGTSWSSVIVGKGGSGWSNHHYILFKESGTSHMLFSVSDGTNYLATGGPSTPDLTLGTWNHIVATWNSTTKCIYLNGVLGESVSSTIMPIASSDKVCIGKTGTNGYYLDGKIQDVRIYNRALSAEEVKILYETTGINNPMKMDSNGKVYVKKLSEI